MSSKKYGNVWEKEEEKVFDVYKDYLNFYKDYYPNRPDLHREGIIGIVYKNRSKIEKEPTQGQLDALDFYMNNQTKLAEVLDDKMWKEWPEIVVNYDLEYDDGFPKVQEKSDLKKVYGLGTIFIYEETENNKCYCGFSGYANFDQDHGIGFVLHEFELIDFGFSDVSFDSHKVKPYKFE